MPDFPSPDPLDPLEGHCHHGKRPDDDCCACYAEQHCAGCEAPLAEVGIGSEIDGGDFLCPSCTPEYDPT